ncbi:MAG: 4Fe-4S dicluster domain-containing protein [Desulfomonile tiedjei]|nr:4Fe-4S dicluster domain-containing protein [Desulfomonile tiedjei]
MSKVRIYQELCKGVEGCGICLSVCRNEVFKPAATLNRKGYRPPEISEPESCTSCENCMIFCPDLAIAVAAKTRKRRVKR